MQGTRVFFPVVVPGTLAANVTVRFTAPCGLQLVEVSAVGSNANDATLIVGNSSDDDAYITAFAIGDSGTPVVKTRTDFVGEQYPVIPNDTVVVVTLDFDGAGGTAAQNVTLLLTFTEG